jgi:iron(III) transport system ATP-binding protein
VLGTVALLGEAPTGDRRLLMLLRPEQLTLHSGPVDGTAPGRVAEVQYHGHDALVKVEVGDGGPTVTARVPGGQPLEPGTEVWLEVRGPGRAWPA